MKRPVIVGSLGLLVFAAVAKDVAHLINCVNDFRLLARQREE